jgi:predicted ATPase/signal transduction histidine kinase/tRNA A-37 threonylcarbamoyl transferase component Bud32
MITLQGYRILVQLYESANSVVYRAMREQDNQSVILKVLKEDYPTVQELTRYKQEYEIIRSLNLDGVVKAYGMEPCQRSLAIILEDFGASSLKQLMNDSFGAKAFVPLPQFLPIAIKTAEILGHIHSSNVIHKDINPANIVLNPETGQLKIIDFGISSQLTRENPTLKNPNVLEGTLAYMSPEQTGRTNRSLDYRTDFYSLGVTFYELLTGQLPFETADALELVHCHIAKVPMSPHEVNLEIPKTVSDIVMKLMAKTAEERYQSAFGIKADLELCLTHLQPDGEISEFPLACFDISDKFHIPQKLYGREAEVETLLAAFERVASGAGGSVRTGLADNLVGKQTSYQQNPPSECDNLPLTNSQSKIQNPGHYLRSEVSSNPDFVPLRYHAPKSKIELMLVAGYSGIGKSALVAEIHKPITEKRGYFIWGKFDQFQRNIPYSAVVSAFKELVRQLLTESEEQLNQWREKLLTAFGSNGQLIIDVIPEVELIVGKQPAVPEFGSQESQNRFNLVFQNFIRAFCSKQHPLVMFLDDLQWADSATLKLIELMMTDADSQYLFLIGAYRDNEVNPTHPLMMTLDGLSKEGATVNFITLAPLALEPITRLIADTLHSDIASVKALAELVVRKTEGNPFFVNEFLKTLHAENLLNFNPPQSPLSKGEVQEESLNSPAWQGEIRGGCWQWNISNIEAMGITDNVVELMIGKVKKLPESTQQVLRLAACVGADFDLKTLSIVSEKSTREISFELAPAVHSGLILPASELDSQLLIQNYKFLHDRVQQAAYALIDEAQKQAVHLQIGRLLLQNTVPEALPEKIFEIVDHLNVGVVETHPPQDARSTVGVSVCIHQQERNEIAKLNLLAGQKAKAATAYGAALEYLNVGRGLLIADSWHSYELTFALHKQTAEVAYLNGDFEQMERLVQIVRSQAKTVLDKAQALEVKILALIAQTKLEQAVETGVQILRQLGVRLPQKPNKLNILMGLLETKVALAGKQISDLADLGQMSDPYKLAALRILSRIVSPAFIGAPTLLPLIAFKQVILSVKHGNCAESIYAYAIYGLILCGVIGDIESGYEFGQLALRLLERFNAREFRTKALFIANGFIGHWKAPAKETLIPLLEAYKSGLETGDLEYAAYAVLVYSFNAYLSGKELSELEPQMAAYSNVMEQLNQQPALSMHQPYHQAVLNLLNRAENPYYLIGDAYDERTVLPLLVQANARTSVCYAYLNKLILCYLFEQYPEALLNAAFTEKYIDSATATFNVPCFYFYDSLAQLSLYINADKLEQKRRISKVLANQRKMKKWAHHAPMNHLHKFYLVEAERYRVIGKDALAMDYYDKAIALAKAHEYINEAALANELAAKFYLGWGKETIAQTYMKEAHYAYTHWGALAKVKDLEAKYPQLLTKSATVRSVIDTGTTTTSTTTSTGSGEALDLATVMKASQAISGEIVLDKLLASLMKILIENAGAQSGFLILPSQSEPGSSHDNWVIQASGAVNEEQVTILQSVGIDSVEISTQIPLLSAAIVHYVIRTKENVVLNDAVHAGQFTQDTYILTKKPKSILCIPLLDRGQLSGILYLENNLTTDAFTPDRVELLKLLSAQVAISIANAQLYTNLQRFNENLEQSVQQRTAELSQTLSELKATQKKLVESEKMASLGGLVAGVAHEINTPVGIGITAASLLAQKTTQFFETYKSGQMKRSQLEKFLDTALQSSSMVLSNLNRAADLIQSFKQVAVDQSTEEQRTFNLKQYLSEVLISLTPKLRTTQHQVEIRGDEAIALNSYPGTLSQIITNLVMNSLTHAYSPEDAGHLVFNFKQEGEQITFEYSDDGKGIPEEHLSKIFDPFFTTNRRQGGSGLGLHIVYNLVTQKLNGTIECESQVGVGTKFIIKLPSQVRK